MLDPARGAAAPANRESPDPEALLARICALKEQVRRLEAEQALHASEERLRLAIVAAEMGIWEHEVIDPAGRAGCITLYEHSAEQVVRRLTA
jgi:PAS domain-containing protein